MDVVSQYYISLRGEITLYIKYENQKYPCKCVITNETIYYKNLPDNFPETVQGEIVLCADDDFEMRTDNTKNYLRQTFENGTLTLTNVPEKESETETETEQPISETEQLRADVDYIAIMTGVEL